MKCILQVDFPYSGPWGDAMADAMKELAQSIANEPGLIWKIWTEDETIGRAGGIYLFESRDKAKAYLDMHTQRLSTFGISPVTATIFDVNETLSAIDRAPL